MTLAELVQLRRAEEQVARAFARYLHERDAQAPSRSAPKRERVRSKCHAKGCDRPGGWRGFCSLHYARWRKGTL